MSEMVTLWACGVDRIDRCGSRYAGTDEHMVRRRRSGGSDRCRISWTGLVTDPAIFCSISAAVIFHQTHRSQIF